MMKKLAIVLLCMVLLLPAIADQGALPVYDRYSMSFFGAFDTVVTILGYAPSMEVFQEETLKVQGQFDRLHQLYDKYNAYPDVVNVYTINREAAKHPIAVSQELFDLIKYCKDNYEFTRRNVNIALGTVLAIWHDSREYAEMNPEDAAIPSMEALQEAAAHTDMDDLILDDQALTVSFADAELQLDVGAVAKGYAVELAAQMLLRGPMPSFVINAGGNVRVGHSPMDGRPNWGVAIQDPDGFALSDANSDILDTLFVSDTSVVTSGDYQRFFVVDGVRYHHIISPSLLMPPQYFRSVSVVTRDSGYADLLSTALYLMTPEEGLSFVEGLDGVDALWILNDRSIMMTGDLMRSAKSQGAHNTP